LRRKTVVLSQPQASEFVMREGKAVDPKIIEEENRGTLAAAEERVKEAPRKAATKQAEVQQPADREEGEMSEAEGGPLSEEEDASEDEDEEGLPPPKKTVQREPEVQSRAGRAVVSSTSTSKNRMVGVMVSDMSNPPSSQPPSQADTVSKKVVILAGARTGNPVCKTGPGTASDERRVRSRSWWWTRGFKRY